MSTLGEPATTKIEEYMDARYAVDMLAEAMMQLEKGDTHSSMEYMRKALTKLLKDLATWESEHGVKSGSAE